MSHNIYTVGGLPKQLSLLLGTIIDNNIVNNWSIYENVNKQTCVTIRFNESAAIDPVQYRRVSERQAKRNIARAARHNINTDSTSTHRKAISHIKGAALCSDTYDIKEAGLSSDTYDIKEASICLGNT